MEMSLTLDTRRHICKCGPDFLCCGMRLMDHSSYSRLSYSRYSCQQDTEMTINIRTVHTLVQRIVTCACYCKGSFRIYTTVCLLNLFNEAGYGVPFTDESM